MYPVSPFLRHFALSLLAGGAVATLWVNLSPDSYYDALEWRIADLPAWTGVRQSLTPLLLVSQVLMAPFFFVLGKELWEALVLRRGRLHGRDAGAPLLATLGGLCGAVLVWLELSALFGADAAGTASPGWVVPMGSDVLLCFLVGRVVFGPAHPALHVLLLIAIASEIAALLALGLAVSPAELRPAWLLLPLLSSLCAYLFFNRPALRANARGRSETRLRRAFSLWPYVAAGILGWIGVAASGLPPALGLLPILPAIPHADRAFGLFAEAEEYLADPLNRLAHLLVRPLTVVLFLFGLTQGGVDLGAAGPATAMVLGAVWIGKPAGILAGTHAARRLALPLPAGVTPRDLALIAGIAGIGLCVPLIALGPALPGGAMQEAARLGLAISLAAGPAMALVARLTRRGTPGGEPARAGR